jgi:response regulator RpfG family c-di-GMP phosphodiesterase
MLILCKREKVMSRKILFVDDEPNVLNAIRRQLTGKFEFDTAVGASEGLAAISKNGPYAVIVSDLRMPVMDGIQFLSRVRELAPDTVRMVLTGNADMDVAIEAVNQGNVFRFLTKPCAEEVLISVLRIGLEQYRLVTAEKELLEKTLKGGIEVLTDLLSMANPEAFGRSLRIKRYVEQIALKLGLSDTWRMETAAMLSQIGWFLLPALTMQKIYAGKSLTDEETKTMTMNPMISADLINNIPRMEEVAEVILYQAKNFDGSGQPEDDRRGKAIPLGSRILKVAIDFDLLEAKGFTRGKALSELEGRTGWYDQQILQALEKVIGVERNYQVKDITVLELRADMILGEDIRSTKGQLLISKGRELNDVALKRLKHFYQNSKIKEPIRVFIPVRK